MAQSLFDALNGVNVDSQTAFALQTILSLQSQQQQNGPEITLPNVSDGVTVVELEEEVEDEDLFQCGKCKEQFTSFTEFYVHKKTHNSVHLPPEKSNNQSVNNLMYSEIVPGQEFSQPITLTGSDILSLGIDQGETLTITGATQEVFDACTPAFLTNDEQTDYEIPAAIVPNEITNTSIAPSTTRVNTAIEKKKDIPNGSDTVTVSDTVQDQMCGADEGDNKIVKKRHGAKKIKCMYCWKSFTKNSDLQQHVRSHTGERPFQCIVCGRAFSQRSNVKKHMATHKVWPKRTLTLFKEPSLLPTKTTDVSEKSDTQGGDVSSSVNATGGISTNISASSDDGNNTFGDVNRVHSENNDVPEWLYMCQYCPAEFKSYSELKSHRKEHVQQKVYRCVQKKCNATFTELDPFLTHTREHEDQDVHYLCHVCNKTFLSLDDLGVHQYCHSVPTQKFSPSVTCKKCKNRYANLESLERHMTLDDHIYPCQQCNKVFTSERYLRRHLMNHVATLNYACPHCSKAFKKLQYLNSHIVIHSNLKPFACQICSATFNRRDKLTRHNLIHENTRRFKCPFSKHLDCPKEFNRMDKLKEHIITHSTKYRKVCKTCDRVFQKQHQLRKHQQTCSVQERSSTKAVKRNKRTNKTTKNEASAKKKEEAEENGNVSTIEILVFPVTRKKKQPNKKIEIYRVMFPNVTNPVDLSQTATDPDQVPSPLQPTLITDEMS